MGASGQKTMVGEGIKVTELRNEGEAPEQTAGRHSYLLIIYYKSGILIRSPFFSKCLHQLHVEVVMITNFITVLKS